MVGADDAAWAEIRPVFDAIATTVVRFGGPGAGSIAKLCNQIVVAGTLTAVAEAVALAERSGVSSTDLVDVLKGGLADSAVLRLKEQKVLGGDYALGGSAANQLKDLRYALELAAGSGARAPITDLLAVLFTEVVAHGDGAKDHSIVIERFRSARP